MIFIIISETASKIAKKVGVNHHIIEIDNFFEKLPDAKIIQDGWVKEDWIKSNLNDKNIDIRHINKFFGLLAFEIWYRKFQKT